MGSECQILSTRQIGAAIFSAKGEALTLGCNEVPSPHGGSYWESDAGDARDYTLERDENERIKRALLADVVRRLPSAEPVSPEKQEEVVTAVLSESTQSGSPLRDAELMDLLEFGRAIHAEMLAISDAARLGVSVKDATLYCTTFPCHICAKHIVASGIIRVVFIEPYPKSYAAQLHKDSIVIQAGPNTTGKVQFAPFIGIAPFRFRELFERGRRKDASGKFVEWMAGEPRPIVRYTVATYLSNEEAFTKILDERTNNLTAKKLISVRKS